MNSNGLLLSFYGDDFTGSTDALESLTAAGARAALFTSPPTPETVAKYPGLQAVGVAGTTRSMPVKEMEAALRPAFKALKDLGAPHLHYKVCSTFDSSPAIGNIGKAVEIGAELFASRFLPLLVGAPAIGRYCVFGNLFARFGQDGSLFRLDRHPSMSRHPVTPSDESDLRLHLARQTSRRISLFDILKVALPHGEAQIALEKLLIDEKPDVVLFDVLYESQLQQLGRLIDSHAGKDRPLFSVGSSGVEAALGGHWVSEGRLRAVTSWPDPGAAKPLLVLSGSCSPVTGSQIDHALNNTFTEVALDTGGLATAADPAKIETQAAEQAAAHLGQGRGVIIHSCKGSADPRIATVNSMLSWRGLGASTQRVVSAKLFGSALGRIARALLSKVPVKRVCVAGGDTSGLVAQALGIEALEMIAPIAPGAPLCRARAPGSPADGLEFNFKGGQVGPPNYFCQLQTPNKSA